MRNATAFKHRLRKEASFIMLLILLCGSLSAALAASDTVPFIPVNLPPLSFSPVSPLDEIASSSAETCRMALETILTDIQYEISGDAQAEYDSMISAIKEGGANTPAVLNALLDIILAGDETELFGTAVRVFADMCGGSAGEAAMQLALGNERCQDAIAQVIEYTGGAAWITGLLTSGRFRSHGAIIGCLLDYDPASLAGYYYTTDNEEDFGQLIGYYLASGKDEIKSVLDCCKLNDAFFGAWSDYFAEKGYADLDKAYQYLRGRLQLGSFEKIANLVPGLEKKSKKGFNYKFKDSTGKDSGKIAIIEMQTWSPKKNHYYVEQKNEINLSPYTFLLVPKNKIPDADDMYSAGTIIAVHYANKFAGRYGGFPLNGCNVFTQNVIIMKMDLAKGKVFPVTTLKGSSKVPKTIKVSKYYIFYTYNPPAKSDIISAISDMIKGE